MYHTNKQKCILYGILILLSATTVKAQSTDLYIPGNVSRIASKIRALHRNPIPDNRLLPGQHKNVSLMPGFPGITKRINEEDNFRTVISSQTEWLVSTTDTIFALYPQSRLSIDQYFYAYNDQGDTTRVLYKSYNTDAGTLENSLLNDYEYDENHNVSHHVIQSWNKKGTWDNTLQDFYFYNAAQLDTAYYSQYWLENQWVDLDKSTTKYDTQNRKIEETSQLFYFLVWITLGRTTYQYEGQSSLPSLKLNQSRDATHHKWANENQHVYSISSSHIDTDTYQVWVNNQWTDSTKVIYSYDSNNRPIQKIKQLKRGGFWIDTTKSITTYHSSSSRLDYATIVEQAWNGSQWTNKNRYLYTYDSSGHLAQLRSQEWKGGGWTDISREVSTFDSYGNEVRYAIQIWADDISSWADFFSETNTYSSSRPVDVPTPIEKTAANEPTRFELFQNYPNPFNPSTVIRYKLAKTNQVHLTIYDLTGRRVATLINRIQSAGVHTVRFNAGRLASGIYFYRLRSGEFNQVRKMLLIR